MTRRNRQKRQADKNAISIDTPIGDEDGTSTLGDMIAHHSTIEKEIFEEKGTLFAFAGVHKITFLLCFKFIAYAPYCF